MKDAGEKRPKEALGRLLKEKGLTISVAESCTGGLLGSFITDVPGSSEYFKGGVIAYGNAIKETLLGVKKWTLEKFGAVSRETAREMAEGVKKKLKSDVGASITGIAGPAGGSIKKPVGTVYIGVSKGKKTVIKKFLFKGSRKSVRRQAALNALLMVERLLSGSSK